MRRWGRKSRAGGRRWLRDGEGSPGRCPLRPSSLSFRLPLTSVRLLRVVGWGGSLQRWAACNVQSFLFDKEIRVQRTCFPSGAHALRFSDPNMRHISASTSIAELSCCIRVSVRSSRQKARIYSTLRRVAHSQNKERKKQSAPLGCKAQSTLSTHCAACSLPSR